MKFLEDQNRRGLAGALFALLLLVAAGPGCASLINVGIAASDDRAPALYGGTLLDGAIILAGPEERGGGGGFFVVPTGGVIFVLALIDLPLSLALDTALLPIVLVWYIFDSQEAPYENLQKPPEEMRADPVKAKPAPDSAGETGERGLQRSQASLQVG